MGPDDDHSAAHGDKPPERPLPPPPTLGELLSIFAKRVALRFPSFDATRLVLAVAAVVGVGGMLWALWGPSAGAPLNEPVRVVRTARTVTTLSAVTSTTMVDEYIVDVVGAVVAPGPVRVPVGARVEDAVRAAGGVRDDADLERVDRAAHLSDGQRIYVPRRNQTDIPEVVGATGVAPTPADPGSTVGGTAAQAPAVVNLNTASLDELDTLPGVGPATAQAIIDHRSANGRFASVDDLMAVKGIGPAKMAKLRPHVTV